jgi:hypothetical protein
MNKEGEGMKDNQFIVIGYNLLDNHRYRKIMTSSKGIELTYQYLRRHIVRAPMRNAYKREVFDKYYMNGMLATTSNEEELAENLFISRGTLRKNISILKEHKLISVEKLETKFRGKTQNAQNVYILGRWMSEMDLNGEEKIVEFMKAFDILTESNPIFE